MGLDSYYRLAPLFEYPQEDYLERMNECREFIAETYPEAVHWIDTFLELLPGGELREKQELYTRSFDVQAITTLDVGYVLFGEDYKRGEMLANIMKEHRLVGNDCGTELGDFLPNLLRLLPKMRDADLAEEIVQELMVPAVRKMMSEFDAPLMAKKDANYKRHHKTLIEANEETRLVYLNILKVLYDIMATDFVLKSKPLIEQTSDFLKSLHVEMTLENPSGKLQLPTW